MHDQIYAQLKAELLSGIRYWFTKEEERELQRHNAAFYHPCPAEEVFHACFRIAKDDEEGSERLSASDIFRRLKMYNPAAMRGSNPAKMCIRDRAYTFQTPYFLFSLSSF